MSLSKRTEAGPAKHVLEDAFDASYLKNALAAMPKPVAVMAAYDQRGAQVLQACDGSGLTVPKHVQVIGVDDDIHGQFRVAHFIGHSGTGRLSCALISWKLRKQGGEKG